MVSCNKSIISKIDVILWNKPILNRTKALSEKCKIIIWLWKQITTSFSGLVLDYVRYVLSRQTKSESDFVYR